MNAVKAGVAALFALSNSFTSPWQLLQLPLIANSFQPASNPFQESLSSIIVDQTCSNPSLSCPVAIPSPIDTCCLNHPSGHFLLAQFWDTSPPLGPDDSWTLHGLWPDYCTGGYPANCDESRDLSASEIASIVDAASTSTHPGLRKYMDDYWKGLHGDDDLWSHEWNKHGTCVSTLEPSCYGSYTSSPMTIHLDLLDYFSAATALHASLKTHDILASYNITPSYSQTYDLYDIQKALGSSHENHSATVKCNRRHELNEIWMHYTVRGSLRNSTTDSTDLFQPVVPDGLVSNCPKTGIKYLPKRGSGDPGHGPGYGPAPTTTGSHPKPTGQPFTGRGHLKVHVLSDGYTAESRNEGCLIRQGDWYMSGTCATYRAKPDVNNDDPDEGQLFTLASSYAPCAVLEADGKHGKKGEFVCANRLPVQSIFGSSVESGGDRAVLTWKDKSVFYADHAPGRFEKVKVFADDGEGERDVRLEIWWETA